MALTVEDGSVVAGADSYISLADAETYFTNHGPPSGWTGTDAVKEGALRYAASWLDSTYAWAGVIVDSDQALDWPRSGVYDDEGRLLAADEIPQRLRDAQCEAALEHLSAALNVGLDRGGLVKRRKVGPLETEFADHAPGRRVRDYLDALVAPLTSGGSPLNLRLVKAGG